MTAKYRADYRRQKRAERAAEISRTDQAALDLMGKLGPRTYAALGDHPRAVVARALMTAIDDRSPCIRQVGAVTVEAHLDEAQRVRRAFEHEQGLERIYLAQHAGRVLDAARRAHRLMNLVARHSGVQRPHAYIGHDVQVHGSLLI